MSALLPIVLWGCVASFGASIFYWSVQISSKYNAWTTSFRERHPNINASPTPQMRELNTKIMSWLFRIVGASFFLLAAIALVEMLNSK
jgi:hypothetical protein